jgi:hypothetical protein
MYNCLVRFNVRICVLTSSDSAILNERIDLICEKEKTTLFKRKKLKINVETYDQIKPIIINSINNIQDNNTVQLIELYIDCNKFIIRLKGNKIICKRLLHIEVNNPCCSIAGDCDCGCGCCGTCDSCGGGVTCIGCIG